MPVPSVDASATSTPGSGTPLRRPLTHAVLDSPELAHDVPRLGPPRRAHASAPTRTGESLPARWRSLSMTIRLRELDARSRVRSCRSWFGSPGCFAECTGPRSSKLEDCLVTRLCALDPSALGVWLRHRYTLPCCQAALADAPCQQPMSGVTSAVGKHPL